jgi:hypothetical protein
VTEQLQIGIEPRMNGIKADHPAHEQSIEELLSELHGLPGVAITKRDRTHHGSAGKGVLQEIFLIPGGTTAALGAVKIIKVKIIKLWLSRDRRRSIDITISRADSEPLTIHASGDNLSLEALEGTFRQALKTYK